MQSDTAQGLCANLGIIQSFERLGLICSQTLLIYSTMALADGVQPLVAAFFFGISIQTAIATFFVYLNGHGSTIFQDRRRLVLITFLKLVALWALIDFISLAIPSSAPNSCQVTVAISTALDQGGRIIFGGFLLWTLAHVSKSSVERYGLGLLIGLRVIAGGLFIGFTRPQFAPLCVARSDILPPSIIVISLDAVIIGILTIRMFTLGMFADLKDAQASRKQEQSKGLMLCVAGFSLWTFTSIAMFLGLESIVLFPRTGLPAIGVTLLIMIMIFYSGTLALPREEEASVPEARSPFVAPPPPGSSEAVLDASTGSPIAGQGFVKRGNLFVVNPSNTPRDSPTLLPKAFKNEEKGYVKLGRNASDKELEAGASSQSKNLKRSSSDMFRPGTTAPTPAAAFGQTGRMEPTGATQEEPPITRIHTVISGPDIARKKSFFNRQKQASKPNVRKLGISGPVLTDATSASNMPFTRMATVDLAAAAIAERERRELYNNKALIAKRPAPPPPMAPTEGLEKSVSTRRKALNSNPREQNSGNRAMLSVNVNGSSTSTSLSPGREDVRRRSPRHPDNTSRGQNATYSQGIKPVEQMISQEQTVMLVNNIVYDNPGMVKSIMEEAPAMAKANAQTRDPEPQSGGSILNRPRPTKKKGAGVWPAETSYGQKHSKSGSSVVSRKSILKGESGSPTALPPLPTPPTSAPPTTAAQLQKLLPNDTRSMTVSEKMSLMFPAPPGTDLRHLRRSSVPTLPRIPSGILAQEFMDILENERDPDSHRNSRRTTLASSTARATPRAVTQFEDQPTYRFSANTYRNLADNLEDDVMAPEAAAPSKLTNPKGTLKSHFTMTTVSSDESSDATTVWESLHSPVQPSDLTMPRLNARQIDLPSKLTPQSKAYEERELPQLPTEALAKDQDVAEEDGEFIPMRLDTEAPKSKRSKHRDSSFLLDAGQSLKSVSPVTPQVPQWHTRIGDELPAFSERRKHLGSRTMPPPTPLLLSASGRNAKVVTRKRDADPVLDSPKKVLEDLQEQLKHFDQPTQERSSLGSLLRKMPDPASAAVEPDGTRQGLLENIEKEMGLQENQWMQMHHNFDRDSTNSDLTAPSVNTNAEGTPARTVASSETSSRAISPVAGHMQEIEAASTAQTKEDESDATMSTRSSETSRASMWQKRLAEAQLEYTEHAPALLLNKSLNFLSVKKPAGNPTPPDSLKSDDESGTEFDSDSDEGSSKDSQDIKPSSLPVNTIANLSLWQPNTVVPVPARGHTWTRPETVTGPESTSPLPAAIAVRPPLRKDHHPLKVQSSTLWSKPSSRPNRPLVGLWGSRVMRPKSIVTRPTAQKPQRKSRRITLLPDIIESPSPLPNKRDTLGIFKFPWGEKSDQALYQPPMPPQVPMMAMNAMGLPLLGLPAHPGPSRNSAMEARSRQLEPEPGTYSSSFFDDYDEEYDDDPEPELDSDDDFDESTLWEIANLLDSKDVPSRKSLLPPPRIIEDYDDSDDEEMAPAPPSKVPVVKFIPIQPLAPKSPRAPVKEEPVEVRTTSVTEESATEDTVAAHGLSPEAALRSEALSSTEISPIQTPERLASPTSELEDPSRWNGPEAKSRQPADDDTPKIKLVEADIEAADPQISIPIRLESEISQNKPGDLWAKALARVSHHHSEQAAAKLDQQTLSAIKASSGTGSMLWTPRRLKMANEVIGLFRAGITRTDFRTSDKPPAALTMLRKPRLDTASIKAIESRELWSAEKDEPADHHWISESSIRPKSPSLYSTSSSGRSSPEVSDTSSLASASTKASSVWSARPLTADENKPAWWDTKFKPKSAAENDLPVLEPTVYKSQAPRKTSKASLETVRESRVLASRDLWEAQAPAPETSSKPSSKALKIVTGTERAEKAPQALRRPTFTAKEDWTAALMEAVAAGQPKTRLARKAATAADWAAALAEAMPKVQGPTEKYDAAVRHPVFFTSNMSSNASSVHPAIGQSSKHDPAVRHPVFFTESMSSMASAIHPAATGHHMVEASPAPIKASRSHMWSSTATQSVKEHMPESNAAGPLWMAPSKVQTAAQPNLFPHTLAPVKKSSPSNAISSAALPTFHPSSTNLWQTSIAVHAAAKHWLHHTNAKRNDNNSNNDEAATATITATSSPETSAAKAPPVSMMFTNDFWKQYAGERASQLPPARSNTAADADVPLPPMPKLQRANTSADAEVPLPPIPRLQRANTSANADMGPTQKPQRAKSTITPVAWKRTSIWTPPPPPPPVIRIGERGEKVRGSRLWEPPTMKPKKKEVESESESGGEENATTAAVAVAQAQEVATPAPVKRNSKVIVDRPLEKVQSTQLWRPKWGLPERPNDWKKNGERSQIDVMRGNRI